MKPGVKSPAFLITAFLIVSGTLILMSKSDPIIVAFFSLPFALGPLFISLFMAAISPYRSCQLILTVGSFLYAIWFILIFLNVFFLNPNPESSVALVFIGAYSLPVMIPIWLLSLAFAYKQMKRTQKCEPK